MVKQYEYNSFSLAAKQVRKAHQRFAFLSDSKAHANNFYIFLQCTYTVYVTLSEEINLTGTVVSNNCTKIKIKRKKYFQRIHFYHYYALNEYRLFQDG